VFEVVDVKIQGTNQCQQEMAEMENLKFKDFHSIYSRPSYSSRWIERFL
jgi:hypothetical protein